MKSFSVLLSLSLAFTAAAPLSADVSSTRTRPTGGPVLTMTADGEWGTFSDAVLVLPARSFVGYESTTVFSEDGQMNMYTACPACGTTFMTTGFQLPSGSRITGMQIQGCDASIDYEVYLDLYMRSETAGLESVGTGSTVGVPGCGYFSLPLAELTVANATHTYAAYVGLADDATVRFSAVRIFYRRQVSPGPATATFSDVPTGHTFFKFVEALVAGGITGGCGGGNYCPDKPVTRGQMAVFLASALGLHWAP